MSGPSQKLLRRIAVSVAGIVVAVLAGVMLQWLLPESVSRGAIVTPSFVTGLLVHLYLTRKEREEASDPYSTRTRTAMTSRLVDMSRRK